ncbi:hypothetical protein LCM23_25150 [Cytobacillus kochii]|uniref:hypothetical protein n=1 Tax=Cytobacillus kochii TaxID=859143 RepID=UPI001CD3D67A|nr:hypothetical protein [Cytobacillus kochii]MCA1029303.1 hypothetical protein [Cytobacillus kochii]
MDLSRFEAKERGFTDSEIDAIEKNFFMSLSASDWEHILVLSEEELEDDMEGEEQFLQLPTGRCVFFEDELLHKNRLSQMD